MTTKHHESDRWQPSPPGALRAIGARWRARRRTQVAAQSLGAGAVLLIGIAVGLWLMGRPGTGRQLLYGGISCQDVQANLRDYAKGTATEELAGRIQAHLKNCPLCGQMFERMQKLNSSLMHETHVASCTCPHCRQHPDFVSIRASGDDADSHTVDSETSMASIAR